jgi:hypothetical protein
MIRPAMKRVAPPLSVIGYKSAGREGLRGYNEKSRIVKAMERHKILQGRELGQKQRAEDGDEGTENSSHRAR